MQGSTQTQRMQCEMGLICEGAPDCLPYEEVIKSVSRELFRFHTRFQKCTRKHAAADSFQHTSNEFWHHADFCKLPTVRRRTKQHVKQDAFAAADPALGQGTLLLCSPANDTPPQTRPWIRPCRTTARRLKEGCSQPLVTHELRAPGRNV